MDQGQTSETAQMRYTLQCSLEGHKGPINSASFLEDGNYLVSGADDGWVIVWDIRNGTAIHKLRPKQGPVVVVKWLRDNIHHEMTYIISAGANGTLVVWRFNKALFLFEWVSMETVFDCVVEYTELDNTHNLLIVTALGRITLYHISTDRGISLSLLRAEPAFDCPRSPVLPILAQFFNHRHSLIVAYLDS
ncbi:hypothetical protein M404DRAFT_20016 [Pisolithus tinctorius Marx 270]|uniref:Uncharacterized protein n=1 Tax=Pisolithus tinctorius Marx 270 TaxID=870435 RepID=A0A0C3PEE3_PISTI|nr:hypothetical protein M404DRAFT_20016 [Pisolithus tinctorius Marx 270]